MVNSNEEFRRSGAGDVHAVLREILSRVQAMRIEEVERQTNLDAMNVRKGLEYLIATRNVEVLRPLFEPERTEYVRLIREADGEHLWQQDLARRRTPDRPADARRLARMGM
jgi:hypothetical protein